MRPIGLYILYAYKTKIFVGHELNFHAGKEGFRRSFVAALLPHVYRLQGLLDGSKHQGGVKAEGGSKGEPAEHVDGQLTFLQISGKILELDGKAALAAVSPALPLFQEAYLSVLRTRCATAGAESACCVFGVYWKVETPWWR